MIPAIKQSAIYISRPNLTVRLTISPWLTKWKRDWKASFLMLEDNHWVKFCDLAARLSSHLWQIVTSIWSHYSRWPSVGISRAQKISAVLDDYKEHNCRPLSSTSEWLTHNFNFARGQELTTDILQKTWRHSCDCGDVRDYNAQQYWDYLKGCNSPQIWHGDPWLWILCNCFGLEAFVAAKKRRICFAHKRNPEQRKCCFHEQGWIWTTPHIQLDIASPEKLCSWTKEK